MGRGFAREVFHDRHPTLIRQVAAGRPYGDDQRARLDALLAESLGGDIARLPDDAADRADWEAWDEGFLGRPWADAPFLWAESYFYRRVLDAVDYFRPGPWHGVDPFGPMKDAELADLGAAPAAADFDAVVRAAVFGNRADLSFLMQQRPTGAHGDPTDAFVADDTAAFWREVTRDDTRSVGVITDNAGRELAADLAMAGWLLDAGLVDDLTLHVKPVPYYVSDATASDVDKLGGGRVAVRTHGFWVSPLTFDRMPADLRADLGRHQVVVAKGDLNYRRLVGDLAWDPTTPFGDAAADLGVAVVALRTCKSEVVVGLDAATVARLDAAEPRWRVSGRHGLVQARSTG